ncbi:MAG: hypothetical protein H6557_00135 [Lewinellaceae bacterium]|nr:hypothetical protein [Phaeodactylibacter sp.]MCB9035008.1 hypothetical protein [Lewinellaceae bacterium]
MKWWVTLSLFCTYLTAYSQHRLPELTKTDTAYVIGGDSLFLVRTFLERCDSPTQREVQWHIYFYDAAGVQYKPIFRLGNQRDFLLPPGSYTAAMQRPYEHSYSLMLEITDGGVDSLVFCKEPVLSKVQALPGPTLAEQMDMNDTFRFIYAFKACIGWDILDSVLLVKTDQGFEGFLKSRTYPLKEGYPVYRPLKLSAKQFQVFHRLELNCRLIQRGSYASASQYFIFLSGSTCVGFVDDGCWEKTYLAIRRKLLGLP